LTKTTTTKIDDLFGIKSKPLTRRQKNGETLTRPPEIEAAMGEILNLEWPVFLQRAGFTDRKDPQYVPEEVLVFLLREALSAGNGEAADEICRILFERVQGRIEKYARKVAPAYSEEAGGDMLNDLFMLICNLNSDKCDFAQVRFWKFLKRVCYGSCKKYWKRQENDLRTVFFDQTDPDSEKPFEIKAEEKNYSAVELGDLQKGLNVLPEPIRTAFVLRFCEGWQVESIDPDEPTISRHFGKTERTIRNWLRKAEELLDVWRREQGGLMP